MVKGRERHQHASAQHFRTRTRARTRTITRTPSPSPSKLPPCAITTTTTTTTTATTSNYLIIRSTYSQCYILGNFKFLSINPIGDKGKEIIIRSLFVCVIKERKIHYKQHYNVNSKKIL